MNEQLVKIRRVLISVSDKTGVVELADALSTLNIEIVSTGGTSQLLRHANIPVRDVSDLTGFPEMMDGRLKTLHPYVHGGILGLRDQHARVVADHGIEWIDLVIVNCYPFAATIKKPNVTFDEAIENIDIGGPTMIRAAAKNMGWVGVVVDPSDYQDIIYALKTHGGLSFALRKQLAIKAFAHTAAYDRVIADYLNVDEPTMTLQLKKWADLRYGENPHQSASAYQMTGASGVLSATQYQGKQLSYNNISDADAAIACVRELTEPACVIVKHANPCGVAVADNINTAFERALAADSASAFGGIVALNRPCDLALATVISQTFFEVIVAPSYTEEALALFATKSNLRILALNISAFCGSGQDYKFITGGLLMQDSDTHLLQATDLKVVTEVKPSQDEMTAMQFAWSVVKHIKSNAILIAKERVTLGVGAGQVSRVDAVDIALKKAGKRAVDAVLASDAFFPFRDSIDRLAGSGIRAIIQPGGSVRDPEVIAACNEHGIAMVFTGMRCFKH